MGRTCNIHGKDEKCIQNFSRKTFRERPLRRPRHGWDETTNDDARLQTFLAMRIQFVVFWVVTPFK